MVAVLNPFRYRGYYYDYETELYYLNSRYYDSETGRFINADDISILNTAKDEINGLNLYAYCFNNPINDTDANGNWSWKKFWKVVGAVAIVTLVSVATGGIAVGIAGALGATTAISSGLMAGAIIGGFIAGGGELISQLMTYGINGLDYGSLFIQTGIGSVIGAFTSVTSTATSLATRTLARIGIVATSGIGSIIQGIHDNKGFSEIIIDFITSITVSSLFQFVGYKLDKVSKYLDDENVVRLLQYLDKFNFGIKNAFMVGLGRFISSIFRHISRQLNY